MALALYKQFKDKLFSLYVLQYYKFSCNTAYKLTLFARYRKGNKRPRCCQQLRKLYRYIYLYNYVLRKRGQNVLEIRA